ncbi:MAG: hypothetical protein ACUVT6_00440 [Thermodesulfobacteriota bacterium]
MPINMEMSLKIPFAIPMMIKIPKKEPIINSIVPSIRSFLGKKLTILPEWNSKTSNGKG